MLKGVSQILLEGQKYMVRRQCPPKNHLESKVGAEEGVVPLFVLPSVLAVPLGIVQQEYECSSLSWLVSEREALKEESPGEHKARIQPLLNIS